MQKMFTKGMATLAVLALCLGSLLCFSIGASAEPVVWNGANDGDGSEYWPYEIYDLDQWNALADAVNGGESFEDTYFLQTGTITGIQKTIGDSPEHPFKGHYDGDSNYYHLSVEMGKYSLPDLQPEDAMYIGAFGYLDGGSISNVTVEGDVWGQQYFAGVCAYNHGGVLTNCANSVPVEVVAQYASHFAGICGCNDGGILDGCYNLAIISGGEQVGDRTAASYFAGVCGQNINGGYIVNCTNEYQVNAQMDASYFGGICGSNEEGCFIINCSEEETVLSPAAGYSNYGGICGFNAGEIANCFNRAETYDSQHDDTFGAICGSNELGSIDDCYYDSGAAASGNVYGIGIGSGTVYAVNGDQVVASFGEIYTGADAVKDGVSLLEILNGYVEDTVSLTTASGKTIGLQNWIRIGAYDYPRLIKYSDGGGKAYKISVEIEGKATVEFQSFYSNYVFAGTGITFIVTPGAGLVEKNVKYNESKPTHNSNGSYSFQMPAEDVCVHVETKKENANNFVTVDLGAKFGVYFYLDLPFYELETSSNAKVVIDYINADDPKNPKQKTDTYVKADFASHYDEKEELYFFKLDLIPAQICDKATVKIMEGSTVKWEYKDFTIKDYCDWQIANTDDENLVKLCEAIVVYGAAAQANFAYPADASQRLDLGAMETQYHIALDSVAPTGTAPEVTRGNEKDFISATLELKTTTELRFNLLFADGTPLNASGVNVGAQFVGAAGALGSDRVQVVVRDSGNPKEQRSFIAIRDLTAVELMKQVSVTVAKGAETTTIVYGAYNYCVSKGNAAQESTLRDMVRALYKYGDAACAYFA